MTTSTLDSRRTHSEFPDARERVADDARDVVDDLRELKDSTTDAAWAAINDGQRHANTLLEDGRQQAQRTGDQLAGAVQEKPLQSLAIAAGAGALLGLLFLRR